MSPGATFWLIVGAAAALLFFVIAGAATWRGFAELRDLLGGQTKREDPER